MLTGSKCLIWLDCKHLLPSGSHGMLDSAVPDTLQHTYLVLIHIPWYLDKKRCEDNKVPCLQKNSSE